MTLSTTTNKITYAGNDATTSFAYTFKIWATADLKVYTRTAGVDTLKTETTHYSVTGTLPGTGNVVFVAAPATGTTVIIVRDRAATQDLDLIANGTFAAENIEIQLDKLAAQVQAVREILNRAPAVPIGNTVASWSLPEPVASQLIGYASDALSLTSYSSTLLANGSSLTTAYTLTLLDDANAGAARTTLGLGNIATVGYLTGSATIDFANVADNASSASSTITVTGAVAGDFVLAFSASGNIDTTNGVELLGAVSGANTVSVYLHNDSGGAFDAASQTIRVLVIPKANVGL